MAELVRSSSSSERRELSSVRDSLLRQEELVFISSSAVWRDWTSRTCVGDEIEAVSHVSGIALFAPKIVFASNNNVSGLAIYVQGKHEFRNVCVAPA